MSHQDPMQVLYHVTKVMEERGDILAEIQKDLHSIKIDIAVMKQTGIMPESPSDIKKERIKDGATGGSIGAVIVAVIIGLFEYIKAKSGG